MPVDPPPVTAPVARPDVPSPLDPVPVDESRMLPPHQTKLDRVVGHVAALSEDLREWTELRIDLAKRQIEGVQAQIERFQHYADAARFFLPAALLGVTAVFFVFITVALGIGELVGSAALGFLITTVLLAVVAGILGWLGLKSVRRAQERADEARRRDRVKRKVTLEDIQNAQSESVRRSAV